MLQFSPTSFLYMYTGSNAASPAGTSGCLLSIYIMHEALRTLNWPLAALLLVELPCKAVTCPVSSISTNGQGAAV